MCEQARLEGAKLERAALEHLVLRLVLADAVRIHLAYTAYTVLARLARLAPGHLLRPSPPAAPLTTCCAPHHLLRPSPPAAPLTTCAPASLSGPQVLPYLYVRPSLAATLERAPASTAAELQLPPRARTLSAALLPSPRPAKARPDPGLDHRTHHLARTTEHWPLSWPWPWPLTLHLTADPSSEP